MSTGQKRRYRTAKDIVVPKGSPVVYITRMKQDVTRQATVIVRLSEDMVYEWFMHFDDALAAGLIEEVK